MSHRADSGTHLERGEKISFLLALRVFPPHPWPWPKTGDLLCEKDTVFTHACYSALTEIMEELLLSWHSTTEILAIWATYSLQKRDPTSAASPSGWTVSIKAMLIP